MTLRVGTLCFATWQGLGVLARSFHRAGVVTDVMVVRHGRHETHDEWYPGAPQIGSLGGRSADEARKFCDGMDVMLFFETPFIWELIPHCRGRGVKTVLMPMYECMPERLPYVPDLILTPSELDARYYPQGVFIPVPVEVIWRQRTRAETFVANLGHGGLKGRNGALELERAIPLVKSPAKFIIRSQENKGAWRALESDPRVTVQFGTVPYEDLFATGDVFVHPTKFDALSLPLQEARAAGMLCMTGDRFPMSEWLPKEGLFPVHHTTRERVGPPYNEFSMAHYDPKDIAATIDRWYGADISEVSRGGRAWAETMSWSALKPRYDEVLRGLADPGRP